MVHLSSAKNAVDVLHRGYWQGHKQELQAPPPERDDDDENLEETERTARRREEERQRELAKSIVGEHMDGTGIWQYTYKCRELGCAPILQLVNQLTEPELSMKHYGLRERESVPLAVALGHNQLVQSADLSGNSLGGRGAMARILCGLSRSNR
jgi:hypothetical protein